jgi:ribosomal protein S18 acetylase RimI-like enzyme
MDYQVRAVEAGDRDWLKTVFEKEWGADLIVAKGHCYTAADVAGFMAEAGENKIGLITFVSKGTEVEIVSLNSFQEKRGIGSALIDALVGWCETHKIKSLSLITSNDNLNALGFYQRRGFQLVKVYPNAIDQTREKFKPGLPLIGENRIPLRDELEFKRVWQAC